MSQLLELWKKLKHKLADRQFLLSLLPALLIALYLAGLLIHAAYNGVRIMFSANTSAEPIWNWNPFVAISSVFSPFGIFLIAFVYGMVFLFSGRARELLAGEKTDKDQRGFEILHDGLHGTSGWMTKEEQIHTLQVGKAESLSGTLIGKMDAEGSGRIAAVSDQLYMSGHVIVYAPTVDFTEEEQWAVSAPGDLAESLDPPPADFMLLNEELAADRQDCLFSEQTATADAGVEQVSEFGHLRNAPIDAKKTDPYSRGPNAREEFFALNVKKLDRRLSAKQQEEWENIYASFRAHSALHGIISGKETISLKVFNAETGANEIKEILCLTVVQYRVKVLIPETELWADGQAHPRHIVSHMVGAQIDYVITNVDRAGNCAVASRRRALELRRNRFKYARRGNQPGDHVMVNVLIVGPKLMRVECWGHDILLTPRSLTYASVADLREEYHSGQQLEAVVKEYNPESDDLRISVKEVNPNPFDDADIRHPVGSECRAIIGGRYRGGVFCRLPDDVTCMCVYSNIFTEYDCSPGDAVLVRITHYDYASKHVYGRIVLRL